MRKETRTLIAQSSKEQSMVLVHTPKGLIKITHHDNIMIVETKRKSLFNHSREIRLIDDIKVITETFSLKLEKGITGYLKFGRVYFNTENGFVGLGKEYVKDKTNYLIPGLC